MPHQRGPGMLSCPLLGSVLRRARLRSQPADLRAATRRTGTGGVAGAADPVRPWSRAVGSRSPESFVPAISGPDTSARTWGGKRSRVPFRNGAHHPARGIPMATAATVPVSSWVRPRTPQQGWAAGGQGSRDREVGVRRRLSAEVRRLLPGRGGADGGQMPILAVWQRCLRRDPHHVR